MGGAEEGTNEGTDGEDRDDEGLLASGDSAVGTESAEPVFHGLDTIDDTSVVTVEDTTKGGKAGLSSMSER